MLLFEKKITTYQQLNKLHVIYLIVYRSGSYSYYVKVESQDWAS